MNVKEMTEEFLVCPKCRGQLEYVSSKEANENGKKILLCRACGEYYPIENGIPILLVEEAEKINQ